MINKDKTTIKNVTTPKRTQSSIRKLFSCSENLFQYVDAARRSIKETLQEAIDLRMPTINITKICPCNVQRFLVVKIEKFIRKMLIFFLFCSKHRLCVRVPTIYVLEQK